MGAISKEKTPLTTGAGIGLKPGDQHYRAYVGPSQDYDLISAMVFNLLTSVGLRQHHRVLDIGCGSLRVGRLLIPYLNQGNYFGVEPNEWLVSDGILNEIGQNQIEIKQPTFSFRSSLEEFDYSLNVDFAVAQSIFSHCSKSLIREWLAQIVFHLKDNGALFATFLISKKDFEGKGWIYPGCVKYTTHTMANLAAEFGFEFEIINWKHPRQTWAVFAKGNYDKSLIKDGFVSWNYFVEKELGK